MNFEIREDMWNRLRLSDKKKVMYGMGNGADKILKVCERYGIEICDFFASEGFVRGHSFHGKTVLSYSQVKEKYGAENITVLLSFATSLPDVLENIYRIAEECELYAPDVPVFGETLFDAEFYTAHRDDIERVYNMLADEESRNIYINVIKYRLSGDIRYLRLAESDKDKTYTELLNARDFRNTADLGAYNGDTVRELAGYAPGLRRVTALEPDRRNFRKLSEYAAAESRFEVIPLQLGAWSCMAELTFDGSGNRNSNISGTPLSGKTTLVSADALDAVIPQDEKTDYIKYDVEGSEREAIEGSRQIIERCRPRLLISAYHRSGDIFELPLLINRLFPSYRIFMRRFRYIPAWDLDLICIPE